MKRNKVVLILIFALTAVSFHSANSQDKKDLIVLVKYKTQPGKDSLALESLKNLVAKVKNEPHYKQILIHVDPVDKSNILLYERWANEVYYKGEHMKTAHLHQFINDARLFLAGPPEITFWKTEY